MVHFLCKPKKVLLSFDFQLPSRFPFKLHGLILNEWLIGPIALYSQSKREKCHSEKPINSSPKDKFLYKKIFA